MRPETEVADILHGLGERIESLGLSSHQLRTLSALRHCRTAELGGHVEIIHSFIGSLKRLLQRET